MESTRAHPPKRAPPLALLLVPPIAPPPPPPPKKASIGRAPRAPPLVAFPRPARFRLEPPRRESPSSRDACGVAARPSRGRTPRVHPRVPARLCRARSERRTSHTRRTRRLRLRLRLCLRLCLRRRSGRSRRLVLDRQSRIPPALAATAAAVSSAASSRMARTASSSGLSFCVSTSAVRVGSSSARGAGSSRPPREKFVEASRRRVRRRSRSRALAVRFQVRSRLCFRLCFRRRRRAEKFRDASVRGGRRREIGRGESHARARHRRLSLRVEHGDGGVGDGVGRLPRRVDRFSAFGVGDGDGVGRLPRLVAFAPRFSVKKVVADRATGVRGAFGKPEASASHLRQLSHASCFPVSQVCRFELGAVLQSE